MSAGSRPDAAGQRHHVDRPDGTEVGRGDDTRHRYSLPDAQGAAGAQVRNHELRPPIMIGAMFEPLGVHPDRLRQDRILDEALHTADPVHLVRVFGITESTAIYYVHAAHPGRQSVIPR